MLPFERMSVVFFAALATAALAMRRRPRARHACVLSATLVAAIVVTSRAAPAEIRAWAGHGYLVAGYWIPALLAAGASGTRFEQWLVMSGKIWGRFTIALPPWLEQLCELAYLLCYPLVPATFAVVWMRGGDADVTRFWVAVLAAGFGCYGSLPWLVSRPPRLRSRSGEVRGIARVNALVLDRMSHRLNTFPSGHVAVSIAAALSLWPVLPAASTVATAIAAGVAVGAVTGRYHYTLDVLAGAVVGLLSAAVAPLTSW